MKLYSKVHKKKLLVGSLIGQTPSELLSPFIFYHNINLSLLFSKNSFCWGILHTIEDEKLALKAADTVSVTVTHVLLNPQRVIP